MRGGSCVTASCANGTSVVEGLGACLSDLVVVPPAATGTATGAIPSFTGLNEPTVPSTAGGGTRLEWWQILLMALGCAFIVLLVLMCLRRRARKKRAQQTAVFARVKRIDAPLGWKERLVRFGERLLGVHPRRRADLEIVEMRDVERQDDDVEKLIGSYQYSRHSRAPSDGQYSFSDTRTKRTDRSKGSGSKRVPVPQVNININRMSAGSMYTEVTGMPRRGAEVRQQATEVPVPIIVPVGGGLRPPNKNRYSASSFSSYSTNDGPETLPTLAPTPAEEYARSVQESRSHNDLISFSSNSGPSGYQPQRGEYWLKPTHTGSSTESKNPFRR